MLTTCKVTIVLLIAVTIFNVDVFNHNATAANRDQKPPIVPYPEGYRTWTHVKSGIVGTENPATHFRGIHHIYANDKAIEGYRTGNFPDGSIIVFDVLERKNMDNSDIVEGERKFIDVMVKDQNNYDSTGHWGFEEFNANSMTDRSILTLAGPKCFNCHATQKKKDFVFSQLRN